MKIRDLAPHELVARLKGRGLWLATGPFVFRVRSPVATVASSLRTLYADFPIASEQGFADYHVRVRLTSGVRRLVRPQSVFDLDGVRPFKPLPGKQAFAMLEWGMNWCIYTHAHEFMILHGAALERNGSALILPAPSGSGKSTLCAALMSRGWRLLSDELILVDRTTGSIRPLGRPISLKNQSIDVMRRFAPSALLTEPIRDTTKGSVAHMKPSADSIARIDDPAAPRWVVLPHYRPDGQTTLEPVRKSELFMALVENAFNYSTLRRAGFSAMAGLVEGADGFRAGYSDLDDMIAAIEELTGVKP